MGLLNDILADKRRWAASAAREISRPPNVDIRNGVAALKRLEGGPIRIIPEVKFQSPSAGLLSHAITPGQRALVYERCGAAMVSVLTDDRYFGGSYTDMLYAHNSTRIPVLCKDFIIDESQVAHAYGHGADAVLLIARCLPGRELRSMATAVRKRRMEPFFEVTTDAELAQVLDLNPKIIGVNARDLDTLEMDPERAHRVLEVIPPGIVAVHLSGLETPQHIARVARTRADAVLIGTALMRLDDPTALLKSLIAAANG